MARKPPTPAEDFVDLTFPLAGVNTSQAFDSPLPATAALGLNVRGFEPEARRLRGGSRPGLVKYAAGQVNGTAAPVQHLTYIVDPQAGATLRDDTITYSLLGPPYPDGGGTIAGGLSGGLLDPSTNNLQTRNPGRYVRQGGSGRQPTKGTPTVIEYGFITDNTPVDGFSIISGTRTDGTTFTTSVNWPGGLTVPTGEWGYFTADDFVKGAPQPRKPTTAVTFAASAVTQTGATLTWAPAPTSGGLNCLLTINGSVYSSVTDSPQAVTGLDPGTEYDVLGQNVSVVATADPVLGFGDTAVVGTVLTLPEGVDGPATTEIRAGEFSAYLAAVPAGCDRARFRLYDADAVTVLGTIEVEGSGAAFTGLPSGTYFVAVATGNASGYNGFGTQTSVAVP